MIEYKIEWLDWDYNTHKTKYVVNGHKIPLDFNDKKQIRSTIRGKVREILQREIVYRGY